jgi:hypothetical protein
MALAVPPLITPIDPIDISAASLETALLIAHARPLRSVGTDASMTDIRGVMVATKPMASDPNVTPCTHTAPMGRLR